MNKGSARHNRVLRDRRVPRACSGWTSSGPERQAGGLGLRSQTGSRALVDHVPLHLSNSQHRHDRFVDTYGFVS
jgi:hypothetical protein